ncbi:kelch-like [Seminavis robusta]|uniref:Kelch-like n=1 Tax=Seminavis robusta TaxID=568900 RepID=A0A9N8E8C0_9STRA|nr:kelch-like [Seminavis robusta]|eukprot:Sro731_g194260.1 kelch-like (299) ;mRNA; f:26929-27825
MQSIIHFAISALLLLLVLQCPSSVTASTWVMPESSYPNPFWPSGANPRDVDALVDLVMKDKTINLRAIPDRFERQLYKSTILTAVNCFYENLAYYHGSQVMGHELRWIRLPNRRASLQRQYEIAVHENQDIDERLLEETAARLLDNQSINQRFLPDALERKLYVNCLKITFRVLALLAGSIRVRLCGHELSMDLSKVSKPILSKSVQRAKIDRALVRQLAEDAVVKQQRKFFLFFWKEPLQELKINLHASLYALLLAITDDLLANFSMELLSDRISLDLAPSKLNKKKKKEEDEESKQ